jgi:hypothetical protein
MIRFARRERLRIFHRTAWVGILPLVLMWAFSWLNLNPKDPTFFDRDYSARYQAGGALAERGLAEVRVKSVARQFLDISQAGLNLNYPVDEQGRLASSGAVYSLVWISFPNPVTEWRRSKTEAAINALRVKDLVGWIGPAGANYRLKFEHRIILWSATLDSQASYEVGVLNDAGQEAATAIYDATCGLLFELRTHTGALGQLSLLETDFKISRNRNWQGSLALLFGVLLVLRHFTLRRKKLAGEIALWKLEADLILFGVLAIWTDAFYDIWFFHYLGGLGLIVIHLALAGYVFRRFGWWGIFPLFEVFWSVAYAGGQEGLEPQFAYNPALILTWVACLLFADFRRRLE